MYEHFGKVHEIHGIDDPQDVYEKTRKAVIPQVSFMIGPKGSGKTFLGKELCTRTNMEILNFTDYICANNLGSKDAEAQVVALISTLSKMSAARVLLEDFPKTEFQAKFFIKNAVAPSRVFILQCSKDIC